MFFLSFYFTFLILMMILLHLYFFHLTGSSNPLGINSNFNKIPFHIYFSFKDLLGFIFFMFMLMIIILQYPYIFSDPDNFIPANPMITPIHIQPEWYFLFAYAILRSIPNKLGGMIALIMSIFILYLLPIMTPNHTLIQTSFNPINQILFWLFSNIFIVLTWAGAQLIEPPFIIVSQTLALLYFLYFLMIHPTNLLWKYLLFSK